MKSMRIDNSEIHKYNLQPYGNDGDTTGGRNLAYLKRNMNSILDEKIINKKTAIDVGCGNGRFNEIIKNRFEKIICVDPIEELHDKFKYDNVEFIKSDLNNLNVGTFDVVFMIGSIHAIWRFFGEKTLEHLNSLTNHEGLIFIMCDINHVQDFTKKYFYIESEHMFDDQETKLIILKKQNKK